MIDSKALKLMVLEFCVQSLEEALVAKRYGARRVELCSALSIGGLTPSEGMISACTGIVGLEVHVLIRPRPGNFYYHDDELQIMKSDIENAARAGARGVVFGLLDKQCEIDIKRNRLLSDLAASLSLEATFHRAFDMVKGPFVALDQLIETGFTRLLTSGQKATAIEGVNLIGQLVNRAGRRIEIMAGSGINQSNVSKLTKAGVDALHFSISKKTASDHDFGMGPGLEIDFPKIEAIIDNLSDR